MHVNEKKFWQRQFLLVVFVVSGFTGLIYESIWTHYLKLFLGHAAYAQALVLAIFMGGLAIGSWLVARFSFRIRYLLWGYLLVEAVTGVLGIGFHRVFVAASNFSFDSVIPAIAGSFAIYAYKWTLAALLILPQSVLLGMTFPLISAGIIRRWPDRPGETLATLYFTNCLGAGCGVLVSGFVLIQAVGLPGTVLTAGLLNIALALAVWSVVRRIDGQDSPAKSEFAARPPTDAMTLWIIVTAFLTGAACFLYELGWIRMLSLVLGASTHAFELMLSAFIFGLAFGGLYVRRNIEPARDLMTYLGWVMLIMGIFATLSLVAYDSMFDLMARALKMFTTTKDGYIAFNVSSQFIAALIMIPTTFCAGMTLPLLTLALMRHGGGERAIGMVYAVNTMGSITGVLITLLVLLPLIGVKGVILTGAAIHIALGLSRLIRASTSSPWTALAAASATMALFVVVAFGWKPDPLRMVSGVYRTGLAEAQEGSRVTYLRDGKTATISLVEKGGAVVIATNGKPDASIEMGSGPASSDEVTMVLAAALPLSLHGGVQRVANIGFGSGLTTHTLLTSGEIKRLDSIEIEPLMVEAARQGFGPRIRNVFEDSRSHIVFEDAKTYFATTPEPYDLIVSEPSNPWVSGVATLFSDEFYGRVVHYLKPDGYFVQWLQLYETDITIFASIIKSLSPHFGAYAIYLADNANVLIVATRAQSIGAEDERIFRWPEMRAELTRVGIESLADIQRRKIGDSRTLGPVLQRMPVPQNSDYFPFVDLNAPRLRYLRSSAAELWKLTLTPMPFLELLNVEPPASVTVPPGAKSEMLRDIWLRQALAINRAVSSGRLDDVDGSTAADLLIVDSGSDQCAEAGTRAAWNLAVRRLSDATSMFLAPTELATLWNKVRASACYRSASGDGRLWPDLFAAASRRDARAMQTLGVQLLDGKSLSGEERGYLTTIVGAASVHLGQWDSAHTVIQTEWGQMDHPGNYDLPLSLLLDIATREGAQTRSKLK
jgi:spermidine synthase